MPATLLGSLLVSLGLDSGEFRSGLGAAEKQMRATQKRFEKIGKSMQGLGEKLSIGLTLPLVAFGKVSVDAAVQSRDALAQVNQTLKSMGSAAGKTTEQLQGLASAQMKKSLYDDDDILRKVTTTLLTFGKVTGATFDRAQQAAIDLSAKFGTDLQGSAMMLGKALNDPVKGITALTRAGVSFTAQQKEQIKAMVAAGDAAGAQKLILAELEKQIGGAAEAAAHADPFAKLKHSMDDLKEAVGASLLKILPPITDALNRMLDAFNRLSPGAQDAAVKIGLILAAAGPVLAILGNLVTVTAPFTAALATIGSTGGVAAAASAGVVGLTTVLGPLAIAIGAAYLAWKNWDTIKPTIDRVQASVDALGKRFQASSDGAEERNGRMLKAFNESYAGYVRWAEGIRASAAAIPGYITAMVSRIGQEITGRLASIWAGAKAKIDQVKGWFFGLYDAVVGHSYIPDMVDGIATNMARLDAVMVNPAKKAAERAKQVFQQLASDVDGIMRRLFPDAASQAGFLGDKKALSDAIAKGGVSGYTVPQLQEAQKALRLEEFENAFKDFKVSANDNADAVETANVRIAKSFKDTAQETISALQNMASVVHGGGFLDILGSLLNLGLQLGGIGVFGKSIATSINAAKVAGARAAGGPVSLGKSYLVGERGPELFTPKAGGQIIPNHELAGMGGKAVVEIVDTTGLFVTRVNGQIMQAAPGIAQAGGRAGVASIARQQDRRVA